MGVWAASATMILLPPPDPKFDRFAKPAQPLRRVRSNSGSVAVDSISQPAVGPNQLFSSEEFSALWSSFFSGTMADSSCGKPLELKGSDQQLIAEDRFLVRLRGFRESVCRAESWYISAMRMDPCRIRLEKENSTASDIEKCSKDGKFKEVRFVLQPVEKTDRGLVYPDVALHVAVSLPALERVASVWRTASSEQIVSMVRRHGAWNDVSLFLGGAGLERWTFARVKFNKGVWHRDALAHGGFYESISDAEADGGSVRTARPENELKLDDRQLMNPLAINPLQGSCIQCHLAEKGRPVRLFRQLGWGLSGEFVVSQRVKAEAEFSARELNIMAKLKKSISR